MSGKGDGLQHRKGLIFYRPISSPNSTPDIFSVPFEHEQGVAQYWSNIVTCNLFFTNKFDNLCTRFIVPGLHVGELRFKRLKRLRSKI